MDKKDAKALLWKAIFADAVASAEAAIRHGADVNGRDANMHNTPLHQAATRGARQMVDVLIRNGADPALFNSFGKTPLDLAVQHGHYDIAKLLHAAAKGQSHASRVIEEGKDKGPPQVGG